MEKEVRSFRQRTCARGRKRPVLLDVNPGIFASGLSLSLRAHLELYDRQHKEAFDRFWLSHAKSGSQGFGG